MHATSRMCILMETRALNNKLEVNITGESTGRTGVQQGINKNSKYKEKVDQKMVPQGFPEAKGVQGLLVPPEDML
ncbi:hypothetical protein NDU88_000799 [Pleurodeles waltl]|uniref:Uncharacterized protein n=1 Tax=Pleurodeles waltl TaxID=8319 RepID=A0AAV7WK20_PLEWA|nr:hypothetical protein NDU88_000799 [Pleurodeles waltl]